MIEKQMRPIGIGRRNSLSAGNEGGALTWAVFASLPQIAKLNRLDPFTWLNDGLIRMVSGEVLSNSLDQLLAWNWRTLNRPLCDWPHEQHKSLQAPKEAQKSAHPHA